MRRGLRLLAAIGGLVAGLGAAAPAPAQKPGGVLRMPPGTSPASMSIHEESTRFAVLPVMGVFNNLVLFDQHMAQNNFDTIRPELAESWIWNEEGTALTFRLRQGVKWHDGKPLTAADVKCTWDMLAGRSNAGLRINPRKPWYRNLEEVATNGELEVTFRLKRPQPSLLALLASGASPVYPCHITPAQIRQHPIGTGPFKFVGFKPNESIKLTRNPDYWKPGRPYLDGIEYTIIPDGATQVLAFAAGKFDMMFPYDVSIPRLRELKSQVPQAECELTTDVGSRTMIVNRNAPPFDHADLRRAMALALDRKAFVDILTEGQGKIGATMFAAAGWHLGHAAGNAGDNAGLRHRCRQAPRRGAQDHAGARLRAGQANCRHGHDPQPRGLSQPVGDSDRPAERDLYRRHPRRGRFCSLFPEAVPQRLHGWDGHHRDSVRRPRPDVLRKLRLRRRAQLYRLLQSRYRQVDRKAIRRNGYRQTPPARLGGRTQAGGRAGATRHLL
jgi:Bacterial extracellular solute-binding proteins, family 5 Middle